MNTISKAKILLAAVFLIIAIPFCNSQQDLNGKWYLRDNGEGSHLDQQFLQVIHIEGDKASVYNDFALQDMQDELVLDEEGNIISGNGVYSGFDLDSEEVLQLSLKAGYFEQDTVVPFNYIRLIPTKTKLTPEQIEILTYLVTEDGQVKAKIRFNQELWDEEMLRINNAKEGEMYRILKIDKTLLLAHYKKGIRKSLYPIEEITADYILLYGVPEGTDKFIGRR
ncbi:MAG: hypothetical protein KJO16_08290 [Muriicola sp.]|nr:hypothetical protein [Muriicola sp.]NNK11903.1 hypothetical protein [Flavobacteriaceae bacterium]